MNIEAWSPIIVAFIGGLLGAIPGVIALFRGLRKERAEVAERISAAAGKLVENYRERLEELEQLTEEQNVKIAAQEVRLQAQARQIARIKQERTVFLAGVQALCDQIRGLGHEPVWEPKKKGG